MFNTSICFSSNFWSMAKVSLLHGVGGLTNILGLAEMAGCQVYTEGCLACIVSLYPIFSLSLLALPPGNSILHPVTNFSSMRMEFKISSRLAGDLILLVLLYVLKPVFHNSALNISILLTTSMDGKSSFISGSWWRCSRPFVIQFFIGGFLPSYKFSFEDCLPIPINVIKQV